MIDIKDDELKPSAKVEVVSEDGMIGDPDNGIPKVEVDPSTGEPIEALVPETPKYSEMNAVQAALSAQPVEFEKEINGLLADRLEAAVERRREEVARSIFDGEVSGEDPVTDSDAEGAEEEGTSESVTDEEQPEE